MADPSAHIEIQGVPGFWQRVRDSRHALLLLDYDGTLAPFHPDRMLAVPLEGIMPAVNEISSREDTTVALVSGRPVFEVQRLTGLESIIIAGTHGFELYRPGSGISSVALPDGAEEKLNQVEQIAKSIAGAKLTERKIATVALHTRPLSGAEARKAAQEFRSRTAPLIGTEIELRDFDGGVEARVVGRDKGVAIREITEELPPADLVVYLGDDDTDEDAFRALPDHGVGIKVGRFDAPTAAAGRLATTENVLKFLTEWIAIKKCQ